jgi:hypothetical protein
MHPELINDIASQRRDEIHVVAWRAAKARRARAMRATAATRVRTPPSDTAARGWHTSVRLVLGRRDGSALRV